jgi:hypothetical protein
VQFDWPLSAKAVEVTGDFWEWKRREKLLPLPTGGFRLSTYLQPGTSRDLPSPAPPFALSAKVGHELSCVWLAVPLAVAEACSWCAGKYEFKFVVDGSWRVSKFCDVVETAVGGENNVIKVRSTATTGASASVGAPRHHRCADRPYGHPSAGVPLKTAAAILCAARRSSCTVSRDDKDAYLSLARERPLRRKRERERRWAGPCLGRRSALRLRLA